MIVLREVCGEQPGEFLGFGPRSTVVPDLDGDGLDEILASSWANDFAGVDRGIVRVFGSRSRPHWLSQNLVSILTPAEIRLEIDAGPALAGALYGIGASLSGTTPQTRIGAISLPLVRDAWFDLSLSPLTTPFSSGIGSLDAAGRATARLTVPPGLGLAASGTRHWSAGVILRPNGTFFVTGPENLTLLP